MSGIKVAGDGVFAKVLSNEFVIILSRFNRAGEFFPRMVDAAWRCHVPPDFAATKNGCDTY